MIHVHTPFLHHLFQVSVTDRIGDIPANRPEDDIVLEMTAFKVDHPTSPLPHRAEKSIAEQITKENLRQNPFSPFYPT